MDKFHLINEIKKLKKAKNVAIFAHNYQRPEIYDVADEIGDSFALALLAKECKPEKLIFCGVTFMAEMAKILSPESRVFVPSMQALCPMAAMITEDKLKALKIKYPKATVLCYVNTTASIKTLCDVCCTSANAVKIASKIPTDEIIFVPDQHLGAYIQEHTDKKIILSLGWCYVHSKITEDDVVSAKKNYPEAVIIVHPECPKEVTKHADTVLSTTGMIKYVSSSEACTFIVATEIGMVELLRRLFPDKTFYGVSGMCIQQKKVTLENLYQCLIDGSNEILLPKSVISKARTPLLKMLKYGRDD